MRQRRWRGRPPRQSTATWCRSWVGTRHIGSSEGPPLGPGGGGGGGTDARRRGAAGAPFFRCRPRQACAKSSWTALQSGCGHISREEGVHVGMEAVREGGAPQQPASHAKCWAANGRMTLGCSACCTAAPMMGNLHSAAILQQLDPLAKKCHCPKHPFAFSFPPLADVFSPLGC